ncbi:MAG: TonB-dependent receptor [Gammaproteobacteria bacterium]|nr:TonB-dependent receptor [Gammaproteobacteria bacterium]
MNNKKLLLPIAISMALYGTQAIAEDDDAKEGDDNVVIITAQKRSQDEMAVPTSVTTLGAEEMQFNGANDLNDLSDMAANFSTSGEEGYQSAIYMRGVGTWSRNIGFDTRVGVYLDGVYLGQSSSLNQAMMGLQQAEVLRGPQGTFFGKNTVAGAVNLISIKPDTGGTEGQVGIELGNFGLQQLSGRFNLPLGDATAIQLTAMNHDFDGEYVNINSGSPVEVGARDNTYYRLQLSHEISENLDLYISYDNSDAAGSMVNGEALSDPFGRINLENFNNQHPYSPYPLGPLTPMDQASLEPFVINSSHTPENNYDSSGINVTFTYETESGATLKSITSMRDTFSYYVSDTDYSPNYLLHVEFTDDYENTSQEFQWVSADNEDFEYLGGIYIYDQEGTTNRDAIPGNDVIALGMANGLPCADLSNGLVLSDMATWCFYPGPAVFNRGSVDVSSWAAYANASFKIAENMHLDIGLRYTDEEKKANFNLGDDGNTLIRSAFSVGAGTVDGLYEDDFLSHSIGLRYQSGNTNYYLKNSTGFKSGGFNTDFIDQVTLDAGAGFDKETVDSWEVGMKGRYMDGKMSFTLAVFDAEYDDYQVNQFVALGADSSTISINNVEKAYTSGLELGLGYQFGDNFSAEFNYGYLDATFGNFPGGGERLYSDVTDSNPINGYYNADATGNPLPYAPEHSISSNFVYETDMDVFGGTTFIAVLNHSYASDQQSITWNVTEHTLGFTTYVDPPGITVFVPTDTIPFSLMEARHLMNLRFGLIDSEGDWDVFLWSKNITDEEYLTESFRDFFNTYTEERGDQRSYGVEVNYYF